MSVTLATGTAFAIASTYGVSKNMTAITNGANAVATLESSHGVIVGDFIEITSGWDLLSGRIARVSAVATNDVTLESINTTDTSRYPAATGAGTVRRITAWTSLSQISPQFSVSGGDQNFADTTFISNLIRQQIPTDRNPIVITLPYFFDLTLPWVPTVRAAADASAPNGFRMVFRNGTRIVANAYWSLREVPTVEDSTLRGQIDLSFTGLATPYAT